MLKQVRLSEPAFVWIRIDEGWGQPSLPLIATC